MRFCMRTWLNLKRGRCVAGFEERKYPKGGQKEGCLQRISGETSQGSRLPEGRKTNPFGSKKK